MVRVISSVLSLIPRFILFVLGLVGIEVVAQFDARQFVRGVGTICKYATFAGAGIVFVGTTASFVVDFEPFTLIAVPVTAKLFIMTGIALLAGVYRFYRFFSDDPYGSDTALTLMFSFLAILVTSVTFGNAGTFICQAEYLKSLDTAPTVTGTLIGVAERKGELILELHVDGRTYLVQPENIADFQFYRFKKLRAGTSITFKLLPDGDLATKGEGTLPSEFVTVKTSSTIVSSE